MDVSKLLDISKLEAGKMRFRFSLKDINSLIKIAIEPAREVARIKEINIIEEYAPDLKPVYIDPEYMIQALSNLINNSLKFTPAKGTVTIRTSSHPDPHPWGDRGHTRNELPTSLRGRSPWQSLRSV